MLDKIILGFLKIKELTAYDIKKTMDQSVSRFYSSSFGSINPALKKLEKQKYVICREAIENHRVKKYYKITETGFVNYKIWLKEPINIGRIKNEGLVRLFFMGDVDADSQKEIIKNYLKELEEIQDSFKKLKTELAKKEVPKEHIQRAKFQLTTLKFGIDYYQFTYEWFNNFLAELENEK